MSAATPSVMWAQRPNLVLITINVSDCINPDIKVNQLPLQCKKQNNRHCFYERLTYRKFLNVCIKFRLIQLI